MGQNMKATKAQTRHMAKRSKGPKTPRAAEIPVNDTPSNVKGDNMSLGLFVALLIACAATAGLGVYFSSTRFVQAINATPTDWLTIVAMTLILTLALLLARTFFWLAFFGPVMLAARMGAWSTCEKLCKQAIKLPQTLSRGSSWASVALVQSLVTRGKFAEAIEVAEAEWQRSGQDVRQVQNLGPLCVTVGIATQVESDMKESLKWNERGVECLNKSLTELDKPKKGIMAKAMAPQSSEWTGQVKTQLAVAHFNIASIYMQKQDHRRAKENFKKSVDFANQAPEFPQKADIVKVGREQLGRLKHA